MTGALDYVPWGGSGAPSRGGGALGGAWTFLVGKANQDQDAVSQPFHQKPLATLGLLFGCLSPETTREACSFGGGRRSVPFTRLWLEAPGAS